MIAAETSATLTGVPYATSPAPFIPYEGLSGDVILESTWAISPIRAVLELASLPENWDGYGSPSISVEVVNQAIRLVLDVARLGIDPLPEPFVGPTAGGGIILEWNLGKRELSLSVLPDGMVEHVKSDSGEPLEEGQATWALLRGLVSWLVGPTDPRAA